MTRRAVSTLKAPEAAPAPATSVHPEPVRLPTGADILHDAVFDGAVPIAASDGMAGDRPIIVPAAETRPGHEWERRAGDLPRGERWKRRLPEVCR